MAFTTSGRIFMARLDAAGVMTLAEVEDEDTRIIGPVRSLNHARGLIARESATTPGYHSPKVGA